MIFRQLFDSVSSTCTYVLSSGKGREAIIIDPVKEHTSDYLQVISELDLKLVIAIDTHTHADHITSLGSLRDSSGCTTVYRVADGEILKFDGISLRAMFTPGHTNESFSFLLEGQPMRAVFTGDVLLIRSTGRTDFQGGDPHQSWNSIVNTLFKLPDDTLVFPAHDYKGWTASSIGEERSHNPRLANKTEAQYVETMRNLILPNPQLMDVAVPANLACGNV